MIDKTMFSYSNPPDRILYARPPVSKEKKPFGMPSMIIDINACFKPSHMRLAPDRFSRLCRALCMIKRSIPGTFLDTMFYSSLKENGRLQGIIFEMNCNC